MSSEPGSILLVDDDDTNRAVFAEILRSEGYQVTLAADGRHAIQALRTQCFGVVITDIIMPNTDGLEVMIEIRKLNPRPSVIPMSGGGDYLSAAQLLSLSIKMGAIAPLVKPFTRDQLLEAVRFAFRQRRPHGPEPEMP